MDKKEFGEKLKGLRVSSGLCWDDILGSLQNKYGITLARSTIYGYEHGKCYPDPDAFMALCQIYGADNMLHEFGFTQMPTLVSDGEEEIVLFESEYSPEDWALIKNFVGHIPTIKPE